MLHSLHSLNSIRSIQPPHSFDSVHSVHSVHSAAPAARAVAALDGLRVVEESEQPLLAERAARVLGAQLREHADDVGAAVLEQRTRDDLECGAGGAVRRCRKVALQAYSCTCNQIMIVTSLPCILVRCS